VGIGLLCALRLSGREALRAEVAGLLEGRGLPLRFGGARPEDVLALVGRDKKRSGGEVPFVLVESPGAVSPGHAVSPQDLRAAVEELHEP
jgi:shikimate kinase/3-dehydroquinate synthase